MDALIEIETPPVQWFYSFLAPGWFSPQYNTEIPIDAVEVSESLREQLLAGAAEGLVLVAGESGLPELASPPPPSDETLAEQERRWRDRQLQLTDPLVTRHRDELELGQPTSLLEDQYQALQQYRAALRQWPESNAFPTADGRPAAPPWLDALLA